MNLSACEPPTSGVPTTPVPQKAAPSPRYNDITRPRALRVGGDGTQQTPQAGTTHSRLWDSSGGGQQVPAGAPNPKLFRGASVASCVHTPGAAVDFPSPWQGTIALPDSDEETVHNAQSWIAKILDDNGADANDDLIFSDNLIANGRALCQVANAIASGAVEVIHKDESDKSNVGNMRSFLVACQKFGVPAGALFDVDDRDPKRIGLCLHVLSRVVRDTVPDFAGPFLSQPDGGPSPCGSSGENSASSSSNDDDTSRGSSTCRVDDDNNDEQAHRERPCSLACTPSNQCRSAELAGGGNPDKTGQARKGSGEEEQQHHHHHHRGEKSFSGAAAEEEVQQQQQQQQQQALTTTTTTNTTTTNTLHARCAPPAHAAPSPFGQDLLWPLGPPPASSVFETPAPAPVAAAPTATATQDLSEEHLPSAPHRRPLSLPSRLSRTLPAGDNTLLSGVPLLNDPVDDTIWDSIFESINANDVVDRGDGRRTNTDGRATWAAPPATRRSGAFASLEKRGQHALSQQPAATSETMLSSWLSNLNLGSFADALINIGVEVMGDLRYVEEKDLSEIGMHGPQIRKLLQNRP